MKRNYVVFGVVVFSVGVIVCVNAYAEKHKCKKVVLPDPVKALVESNYPQAKIEKVQLEKEGLTLYEIELKQDGLEYELTVAPDGTIVEEESQIKVEDLPEAVKTALAGAKVEEAQRETTYWVVTLKKLEKPEVVYEVEIERDGKELEVEIASDGTTLKQEFDDDDDDNGDDGDDDTNDDKDNDDKGNNDKG
jgi:hypothetical protein